MHDPADQARVDEERRLDRLDRPRPAPGPFEPRIGRSVSLDTAAHLLGISRRSIYNRIHEGRLETIRTIGGSQRVLLDSLPRKAE